MKKIIIAIDGYSSTGKSTVARQLADYLNYIYVDSGAMYRAVALFALQNNYLSKDHFDKQSLLNSLTNIKIEFLFRKLDQFSWQYCNKGFFNFKNYIPKIITTFN